MTSLWGEIRLRAREWHAKVLEQAGGDPSAAALIDAATELTEIPCFGLPGSDPLLDRGEAELDLEAGAIWFRNDIPSELSLYHRAHEFAHFWLDDHQGTCHKDDLSMDAGSTPPPVGVHRVEGYGPHERRERRANVFASEFLLPSPSLRQRFAGGENAREIARHLGLPLGLVVHQLARALLIPEVEQPPTSKEKATESPRALDPSQERAAFAQRGPVLVEAGPGTGKTRTLIARIERLLAMGCAPGSILALTYSNRAAEELRQRIAQSAPAMAPNIWLGTFHAFGLELLRKYGSYIGLPPNPIVLDQADSVALLEAALPELSLDHYQNLQEPTAPLRDILSAISRAKDENVSPKEYAELAERMLHRSMTDEEQEQAEKAVEVARVYTVYQDRLKAQGKADFGDLVYRAIELLRENPSVAGDVRAQYIHVLVDEYQDINRASILLLREIVSDGRGLWAVGDGRQAIYRFRGAAPATMANFTDDFPGATVLALETNYRSQPAIVNLLSELAPQMRAYRGTTSFCRWQCDREFEDGIVRMAVAADLDEECGAIASEVRLRRKSGIPYRHQAVLCKTHAQLARVAVRLEAAGIPSFYLGSFFERDEIRDLLSVISLAADPGGTALYRVGRFPEYRVAESDIQAFLGFAREGSHRFPEALKLVSQVERLSETGRRKLSLLASHFEDFHFKTTPWKVLSEYLFIRSRYLSSVIGYGPGAELRRIAIYQLLKLAYEARRRPQGHNENPKYNFLEHVRQLESFGDGKALREIPEDAESLDAVRLSTVHASKGLEFRSVYIPFLSINEFAVFNWPLACPPPDGMLDDTPHDLHEEELECLFFVALSRAQENLYLSRAEVYGKRRGGASPLLKLVENHLPRPLQSHAGWTSFGSHRSDNPPATPLTGAGPIYRLEDLELYRSCPRSYFYRHICRLPGRSKPAYAQFHQSVFDVLHWLHDMMVKHAAIDLAAVQRRLAEIWQERELDKHVYSPFYREKADQMTRRLWAFVSRARGSEPPQPRQVDLAHGSVVFTPDHAEQLPSGDETLTQFRTGRLRKTEHKEPHYALFLEGVEGRSYQPPTVQVVSLSNGAVQEIQVTPDARKRALWTYDAAMRGIAAEQFPATPSERMCPGCPYYFVCSNS